MDIFGCYPSCVDSWDGGVYKQCEWSSIPTTKRNLRGLNFHSQRVNQVLEQYLRCTINYQQDDWTEYLPFAEFAYNNTLDASTQQTPFFANYGYHPKLDLLNPVANNNPTAEGFAKQLSEL